MPNVITPCPIYHPPRRPNFADNPTYERSRVKRVVGIPTSMIQVTEGGGPPVPGRSGGLVNASGQLVTIRPNDQAFRKLKEVCVECVCFVGKPTGFGWSLRPGSSRYVSMSTGGPTSVREYEVGGPTTVL